MCCSMLFKCSLTCLVTVWFYTVVCICIWIVFFSLQFVSLCLCHTVTYLFTYILTYCGRRWMMLQLTDGDGVKLLRCMGWNKSKTNGDRMIAFLDELNMALVRPIDNRIYKYLDYHRLSINHIKYCHQKLNRVATCNDVFSANQSQWATISQPITSLSSGRNMCVEL